MNRKEAEEIFIERKIEDVSASLHWAGSNSDGHWCMAKGFLEGSDYERKRAEVLVKALEDVVKYSKAPFKGDKWDLEKEEIAKDALSQYQKSEEKWK